MAILNYSTTVGADKSISEIELVLVRHNVKSVMKNYEDGQVIGLSFVIDPPHLEYAGDTSIMALKYGKLRGDWRSMLRCGFDECMRVLKPNGVLIFKWSEIQFPLSEILPLFSQKPLFGNRCRKRGNKTHWLCFMKED